jgi:cytochrome P450
VNRDEAAFDRPDECILDRRPNRHLAFGFGPHTCIGAPHARLILSTVLRLTAGKVQRLAIHGGKPKFEDLGSVRRQIGFESLELVLS